MKLKLNSEFKKLTNKEKAKKLNVNVKTVVKYFAQDRADYLKENAARRAEMYALKCQGLTLTQIAAQYNCTKNNVSLLIKKHKQQIQQETQQNIKKFTLQL